MEKDAKTTNENKTFGRSSRLETVLRAYSYAGLLIFFGGILFFTFLRLDIDLSTSEGLALLSSLFGLLLAVLSTLLVYYRKQNLVSSTLVQHSDSFSEGNFIDAWQSFERASKNMAFNADELDLNPSIRDTLEKLVKDNVISKNERWRLDEILNMRNSIVHRATKFDSNELQEGLDDLVKYISKVT
ncbi:hypothetical protein [Parasphingorhabdus sp.]|uniref:hypothetical protein n=1 Tax=Parasphingorhabdus sp. TaxID=2709688 RepID=UPI002F9477B8